MKKVYLLAAILFAAFLPRLFAQPNCNFTLVRDSGCIPFAILAFPIDTGSNIVSRKWTLTTCSGAVVNFTNSGLNPTYSYVPSTAGCYCLKLWVQNNQGDTCSFTTCNIVSLDTPNISAQVAPTLFCAPQTVTLNINAASNCGTVDSLRIQWGCGNMSAFPGNPGTVMHLYSGNCNPQCYDINIIAINSCGCTGTKKLSSAVCVLPRPQANFHVDVTSGVCVPSLTSHFVADSMGLNFTYCWFVNGVQAQCSSSRSFTRTFAASSSCYDVKLVVSNSYGCLDSMEIADFICVTAQPQLSFSTNSASVCIDSGQIYQLCLTNTSSPVIPNPLWKVTGPGISLGPFIGNTVCIPLSVFGNYSVKLIGNYGPGCIDSVTINNVFMLKQNPIPCFYASDTVSCSRPLLVNFTNCSNNPGGTCTWSLGNGLATAQCNPTTVYNSYGTYPVTLTVTALNGCVKSLTKANYITIDSLHPSFLVSNGCGGAPVLATCVSTTPVGTEPISSYLWEVYLNGNLVVTGQSGALPHTYTQPGCYDVRLTVTTASGCVTSSYESCAILVGNPPCILQIYPNILCLDADTVSFSLTCNHLDSIKIHFGDEANPGDFTTLAGSDALHDYQMPGVYNVMVIPVLTACVRDTMTAQVTVLGPAADFSSHVTCLGGDTICFQNNSIGANSYHWKFNCIPDTFVIVSPCVLMPHCDTCRVTLTAFNDTTQCANNKSQLINTACGDVEVDFTGDTASCIAGLSHFYNTTPGHVSGVTQWYFDGTGPTIGDSLVRTVTAGIHNLTMIYVALGGCRDTVTKTIKKCDLQVDFTPSAVCLPDSFHFQSYVFGTLPSGCGSIISWLWNFGGGDTSPNPNPVQYFPFGLHSVTLQVINSAGCTASITKTVRSATPVYGDFQLDTNICPGSTVCIDNYTTSGANLTEIWSLSGASIDSFNGHAPPCVTYPLEGDFPVVHHVTAGTCNMYDTVMVHVHEPQLCGSISADFFNCPNPSQMVCATNCSQYVDSMTDVFTWNFGNGEYLEVNPCTFYTFPGCYPVSLTVLTNNGCRDTVAIDTVCIIGPHVSSYSVSPTNVCAWHDTVHFSIATVGATQLTFVYGCNQGFQIVNPISPVGTESNPTVLEFDILYYVTDSCLPQITLGNQAGCQVLYNLPWIYADTPAINFNTELPGACVNNSYCFHDSTVYAVGHNYTTSWYWDMGDSFDPTTSSLQNPCHTYTQPGVYPVTFSVSSWTGCVRTLTKYITIHTVPEANFSYAITDTCDNATVCFQDLTTGGNGSPAQWYWDFGDGNGSNDTTPYSCHPFILEGPYQIQVIVTDNFGCTDTTSMEVNVNSIHHMDARIEVSSMIDSCDFTKVCFVDSSSAESSIFSSQWNINGVFQSLSNPCVLYNAGVYTTALRMADASGCADTAYRTVTITGNPMVAAYTKTWVANTFQFTNTSTGNYVWEHWAFGDGNTSTAHNPSHTFTTTGVYTVTLTIRDEGGCERTYASTISVIVNSVTESRIPGAAVVKIIPNPFNDYAMVEIVGINGDYDFVLSNAIGQTVVTKKLSGDQSFTLQKGKLAGGLYLYAIVKNDKCLNRGKIVIE